MSNETTVTVRGWAGSDAKLFIGENSAPATAKVSAALVNVGVTPRIFDRKRSLFGTVKRCGIPCAVTDLWQPTSLFA